jgi:2-polyprenyl-3-methyl-5-hydroxy-6-metoxy-1,4-benzoquinol methylase
LPTRHLDDAEWFELQFEPQRARSEYGIPTPGFPADSEQITFTGMSGRQNLQQAFSFYRHVRSVTAIHTLENPRILDFGAGWGRIARLWLRETDAGNITVADTMPFAIECLQRTGAPYRIVHNPPAPPLPGVETASFDLIYAYSVFSHLSEAYSRLWIEHHLTLLRPGGWFVFTTRGDRFISDLAAIKATAGTRIAGAHEQAGVNEYQDQLRRLPEPDQIRERMRAGEFQFFAMKHSHHIDDCTGETIIPESWLKANYGRYLVSFSQDVPEVDQGVAILRRPPVAWRRWWPARRRRRA